MLFLKLAHAMHDDGLVVFEQVAQDLLPIGRRRPCTSRAHGQQCRAVMWQRAASSACGNGQHSCAGATPGGNI
jgi:hypothetical protein